MPRQQKQVKVGHVEYRITPLGAQKQQEIEVKILRAVGGALPALFEAHAKGGENQEGLAALGMLQLARALSEADYIAICSLLSSQCEYSEEPGRWHPLDRDYDDHFSGQMLHHKKWLFEALKVNFADFFSVAGAALRAPAGVPGPFSFLRTSTGSSGSPS